MYVQQKCKQSRLKIQVCAAAKYDLVWTSKMAAKNKQNI